MELLTLQQENHQVLRQVAQKIEFPLSVEVRQFIKEMCDFIQSLASPFSKPAGLAAPQVGCPWQIICFQIPEEARKLRTAVYDTIPLTVLINPSYEPLNPENRNIDWEGCYSVPDKMGEVARYNAIHYRGYTPEGELVEADAYGFLARVLQHEIGHLNGELYLDLVTESCRYGDLDEMLAIRKKEFKK